MRERDEKGEAPPQLPTAWFFLGSVHIQATCGGRISHCDPRLQDCFQPKAPSFPCGHTSCAGFAITAFFLTLEILYNFCKKYFKAKKKSLIIPLPPSGKNPLFIYLSIQSLSTFIEDLLCAGHCQIWRGWQQKKQTFMYREGLWYDVTSSDNTSWRATCVCVLSRPVVSDSPLSVGFPRQEFWSGFPFPSPGDLPEQRIELRPPKMSLRERKCVLYLCLPTYGNNYSLQIRRHIPLTFK